jgi:hypothetical protein
VTPHGKAALLWAATGTLVFLVIHQAYLLMGGAFLGVGPVAAVAVAVFATTGAAAYYLEARLLQDEEPSRETPTDTSEESPGDAAGDTTGE